MALKNSFLDDNTLECGCDEAGRGCLAGPLFVAAVILPKNYVNEEINDSKQLSRKKRDLLRIAIERDALAYSVVAVSESQIVMHHNKIQKRNKMFNHKKSKV